MNSNEYFLQVTIPLGTNEETAKLTGQALLDRIVFAVGDMSEEHKLECLQYILQRNNDRSKRNLLCPIEDSQGHYKNGKINIPLLPTSINTGHKNNE